MYEPIKCSTSFNMVTNQMLMNPAWQTSTSITNINTEKNRNLSRSDIDLQLGKWMVNWSEGYMGFSKF